MRALFLTSLILLVVLTAALPVHAERDTFPLLDYRTESWFLPQSPGVTGGPAAGLFNAGAFGMTGRAGSDVWWNDRSVRPGLDNYGFGVGRGLNFAMNTTTWGDEISSYKTYDYQLGLAGGTRRASLGLAYRWANGETQRRPREKAIALGDRRAAIGPLTTDYPFSLPLSHKLRATESTRRMRQFAINLQGAAGALYVGDDEARQGGFWQRAYFNSFSATIGGGTSQVQANIIAEHILGLPK